MVVILRFAADGLPALTIKWCSKAALFDFTGRVSPFIMCRPAAVASEQYDI